MKSVYKVKEDSLSKWLECLYSDIYELSEGYFTWNEFGISPGMIDAEPTCSYDLTGIRYNGCSSSSSYVYYINLSICYNKREGASDKRYLLDGEGFTYYNNFTSSTNLTIRFDLFLSRWSDVISLHDFDFDFKVNYISESSSGEKLIDYKCSDGSKYKVKLDFEYDYLSKINSKVELVLKKQLKREYELNRILNCDYNLVCFIRKNDDLSDDLSGDIEVYYDFIEGEIVIYDIVDFCSRLSLYGYKGLGISFNLPDSIKQHLIEWSYQQWGLDTVAVKLGEYRKNDKLIVLDSI